jgi:hypothetical protein
MPVSESTDNHIVPKSVLRHRPIGSGDRGGKDQRTTGDGVVAPIVKRASRQGAKPVEKEAIEIDEWERATGGAKDSVVETRVPPRKTAPASPSRTLPKTPLPHSTQKTGKAAPRRVHPLLYLGLGMLFMLALWTLVMGAAGWIGSELETLHYGYPRTYQTDQFVGHNESAGIPSHFIAINLHGRIEVIEFPGGDASHARVYEGPQLYTANADLAPVTLKFEDVNGDHKLDMLVCFQGSQIVYINTGDQFVPLQANQRIQVEQFLQHPGMSC